MDDLAALGRRICIFGPSNAGKSTLAVGLGRRLGVPAIHLDLLHHLPGTDWTPRAPQEFARLHAQAIAKDEWVMEGNYSRLMPERLARATGAIWIDTPMPGNLWRYVRRTLFERDRVGALEGGQDSLKWLMVRHIAFVQPRSREKMARIIGESGVPLLRVGSLGELNALTARWDAQSSS